MMDEHNRFKADNHQAADASADDKNASAKPRTVLDEALAHEEELLDDTSSPKLDPERHAKKFNDEAAETFSRRYIAYTVKLPSDQLSALQSIWLELKHLYGANSPDKSGMIQQAVEDWLRRWDGQDRAALLEDLLEIRQDTRKRQYRKY